MAELKKKNTKKKNPDNTWSKDRDVRRLSDGVVKETGSGMETFLYSWSRFKMCNRLATAHWWRLQTFGGAAAVRKSSAYVVRKCHQDLLCKRKNGPLCYL